MERSAIRATLAGFKLMLDDAKGKSRATAAGARPPRLESRAPRLCRPRPAKESAVTGLPTVACGSPVGWNRPASMRESSGVSPERSKQVRPVCSPAARYLTEPPGIRSRGHSGEELPPFCRVELCRPRPCLVAGAAGGGLQAGKPAPHPCGLGTGEQARDHWGSGVCPLHPDFQTSTCSAIASASSTSIPRYLTVLSTLGWPSSNWTARRLPVRR